MKEKASRLKRISGLRKGRLESTVLLAEGEVTVLVASQREVEAGLELNRPHVIVSMLDSESRGLSLLEDPHRLDLLHLRFHDTKQRFDAEDLPAHLQPLTLDQARTVCEFVRRHVERVEVIVVHCHHGMSRSPAVAAALAEGLGGDNRVWFERKFPNRTVYELVLRAWREGAAP